MAAPFMKNIFGASCRIAGNLMHNYLPNGSRSLASLCNIEILPPPASKSIKQLHTIGTSQTLSESLASKCLSWPVTSVRNLVRYSRRDGKKKPVKAIVGRFLRLDWGIYIRARAGRNKHKWKKSDWILERGKYHVFCNKQQSRLYDKMTTKYWKRKHNYVNDPYERYQKRFGMKEETAPKFLP